MAQSQQGRLVEPPPASWKDSGNPSSVNPHGTASAGTPANDQA
jgi:hypothetical protein